MNNKNIVDLLWDRVVFYQYDLDNIKMLNIQFNYIGDIELLEIKE